VIRDRTRISRVFGTRIGILMQRIAAKSGPVAATRKAATNS
jgi:hypothetical protein